MYTQTEKVNIEPKSYLPVFRVSQNDIGRILKAHLISDDGEITIPAGATVTMAGIKPSGLGYTVTGTFDGSDVTFETDATMTDEAGQIESEIRIVDGETLIGTTNVVLNVEPNPHPDDTTDGQREPLVNEITALLNQITAQADRTEEYSSKVLNMTVTAHESEEPTVTKTEGEVVNLDFGLPRGAKGERGERGEQGEAGKDGKDGIDGKDGKDGINGVTPDFSIGTVTTLEPNESASVTLTGTEEEPVLNFGIPRGEKGEQGDVSLSDLEKVMVTDTASGAIASFPDGSDLLPAKSLTATIVPQQSGTGTPSPDNVRQISGWESVETVVSGVNVWDEEWEQGGIDNATGQNVVNTTIIRSKNYIPIKPNAKYYVKAPSGSGGNIFYYDCDKGFIMSIGMAVNVEYTVPSNACYMRFRMAGAYGSTYNHDISINYPSTDHDYHAYAGHTHTTSLGRTVYGGTVDVVSGTLTVDSIIETFDAFGTQGDLVSEYEYMNTVTELTDCVRCTFVAKASADMSNFNRVSSSYDNPICSLLPHYFAYSSDTSHWYRNTVLYAFFPKSYGTTVADVSQTLYDMAQDGKPLQFILPLVTPQTYQLTPQTINTLFGENNVWADSGDCSIVYYADTKLYIDKKLGGN